MAQITIADTTPRVQYTVGSTPTKGPYTIPFVYFEDADIKVYFDSVLKTLTTDYTISGTAVDDGFSGGTVLTQANQNSITITIERDIAIARTTDFPTSGIFNIATLNTVLDKLFAISQWLETKSLRTVQRAPTSTETYSLEWPSGATTTPGVIVASSDAGIEISSVNPADLTTSLSTAAASATAAATSETNAGNSETSASNSATAAAASYDSFDDRYLGQKSSAPSTDNDSNALVVGALYFNTSDNNMYVRNAANNAWITVSNNTASGTATTKASEAAASAVTAANYAVKVDGVAAGSDHSAKAWAVGGTGITDTASKGAAKEWATEAEDNTVAGAGTFSALHYAAKATAQASAAVTAKNAAETAEGNAETAETAAEAAQTASVNAKNAAEAAETAAEAAQAAAEAVANGISWKAPCLVATTANVTLSGVQTIDGVSATAGSRVLVKDQSNATQNGVYTTAAGAWARAVPMNVYAEFVGAIVPISQGSVAADTAYICTADSGGTLGSTNLPWNVFGVAPQAVTVTVDNYAAGSDFTAGSTTSLAMSVAAASENDILVLFDGVYQHHNTFTVSSTTVSFSSAIPTGTLAVEIRGTSALSVGVPGAGTVGTSQLVAGPAKDLNQLAVTNNLMYVGDGSNIVAESGATLRTSIGVAIGSDVMAYDATMLVDADIGGSVQAFDANNAVTDLLAVPASDHTWEGPTTNTLNAGYTNALFDLVYLKSDGEWYEADADATTTSINMLGLALEVSSDGNPLEVALPGSFIRDDTWAWTIGAPLYISGTLGAVTHTAPSGSGDVVRTIGYALSADVIFFQPSSDYFVVV